MTMQKTHATTEIEKTPYEDHTENSHRTKGGTISGNVTKPYVADAELLRRVGQRLYGTHWQADFSKQIGVSKAQVTRWLNGSRVIPGTLNIGLQQVVVETIIALAATLKEPGMPEDEQVDAAAAAIIQAAETLLLRNQIR